MCSIEDLEKMFELVSSVLVHDRCVAPFDRCVEPFDGCASPFDSTAPLYVEDEDTHINNCVIHGTTMPFGDLMFDDYFNVTPIEEVDCQDGSHLRMKLEYVEYPASDAIEVLAPLGYVARMRDHGIDIKQKECHLMRCNRYDQDRVYLHFNYKISPLGYPIPSFVPEPIDTNKKNDYGE